MGRIESTAVASTIRGKVGNLVFRRTRFGVLSTLLREPKARVLSEAELAVRSRFSEAARFAKTALANPVRRAVYAEISDQQNLATPQAAAMRDFLRSPSIDAIDFSTYVGQAGHPILVSASDDCQVVGVTLLLRRNSDAQELESGPATLVDGKWRYVTTTQVAAGTAVRLEVTATDSAGNGTTQAPILQLP